jgi:hypothetical protein
MSSHLCNRIGRELDARSADHYDASGYIAAQLSNLDK